MSVTYRQNDNHTDIYDGKMANCCQKVRGNKTNQRPKQQQNYVLSIYPKDHRVTDNGITVTGEREINPLAKQ